jgi:cysteine synthase
MTNRGKGYGPPLNDISESVGNTPLVRVSSRTCPPGRTIYAKCEYFNPLSSVKDRLALAIIEAGERDGSLTPGQTVVEATSGNTGIGESKGQPLNMHHLIIHCRRPRPASRRDRTRPRTQPSP